MIIILGAGISGLYLGYLLKKMNKEFIIFEKEEKYGGRILIENFEGNMVNLGAGVGRLEKDKLLFNLCKELDVPFNTYKVSINYSFDNIKKPLLDYVDEFKKKYKKCKIKYQSKNFLEFLEDVTTNPLDFISLSGYTDYIHADIEDTLYNYGFDDNVSGWTGMSIKWQILLDKLYETLKYHIKFNINILEIDHINCIIKSDKGDYKYNNNDKIISSLPVNISRNIFSNISISKVLNELNCQSFSRIYIKVDKRNQSLKTLKNKIVGFTITDSFLQKIIPIKEDIYMIGYNDNYNADLCFDYFSTLDEEKVYEIIEKEIYRLFNVEIKIIFGKIAYWKYGTTYYLPLPIEYKNRNDWLEYARNPFKNIYFIGEGFSHNQGWVEGCLESVYEIINMI
jgi:hypothetical protein